MVRTLGIEALLVASFVAGCGTDRTDPGGGPSQTLMPQVSVLTPDLATSAHVATVQIISAYGDVSPDLLEKVAARIRVATWPGDVEVATTEIRSSTMSSVLPNGAQQIGSATIETQLDPALDASAWYAISLPAGANEYGTPVNPFAFVFDGGARGSRFSPAHAPVVASVMSCAKDGGVVAVYARYSEPVVRTAGATPLLDYGVPPAGCAVGGDSTVETQFICSNAGSGDQPLWLEIRDGVTAQASGVAMVPGRLDSTAMQTSTTNDGCTVHKPLTVD